MPAVSVLIATYNRAHLLPRAINSVLAQDFGDFEIVVIDDCSTDNTASLMAGYSSDPRIFYVRNQVNLGGKSGDAAIIQKFLRGHCRGEFFVYLCDDDYWIPRDLLSRQVAAMRARASIAFVQGGMVHKHPTPVALGANADYVTYSHFGGDESTVFWGTIYPRGLIPSRKFLRLYAADPKNRNIVTGATLYRLSTFLESGVADRLGAVRWQAGYLLIAGPATRGDVYYIDEPCLMTELSVRSASLRGTQLEHMLDCFNSIDAALLGIADAEIAKIRFNMMKSVFKIYLCNKVANKFGWFEQSPLGDISHALSVEITGEQFVKAMTERGVPLSTDNMEIIRASDWPAEDLAVVGITRADELAS